MQRSHSTRREFLGKTVTAAAATTALPLGSASGAKKSTCGLAIGTYGLQSMPLDEALRVVAKTGYDAVEITVFKGSSGDHNEVLKTPESRKKLKETLEETGLRLCALMADLKPHADKDKHFQSLEELLQLIELADQLKPEGQSKTPLIQTVLGQKNWLESRNLFRDRLADWNRILADLRGTLSIKPHRSHAMSDPTQAQWLFDQLGNPRRLRMVYDYSHYAFQQPDRTITETVAAALPITNYIAVKDAIQNKDGKIRFGLAGESGNWELANIISPFFKGGYRGDFCCEVSSHLWRNNPQYDPIAATETCYQNMLAAFQKAGVSRD